MGPDLPRVGAAKRTKMRKGLEQRRIRRSVVPTEHADDAAHRACTSTELAGRSKDTK